MSYASFSWFLVNKEQHTAVKNLMNTYSNSMTEFHCKPSLFSSLFPVVIIKGFSFSLKK